MHRGRGSAPAVTPATPSVPVLQPGKPGQPNATLTGSAAAPVTTPGIRPGDARFLTDMVTHHAQAIVMVDAVASDLTDRQVASLASRIRDEQRPEIDAMAGYLEQRGAPVPPEATNPNLVDHGSHSMPGMASEKDLRELAAATGAGADRLFLTLMIRHHEGALTMVEEHARQAADERVEEIAADINVTQAKQIDQMRVMLARLG
ncbi:DUF305 domain-containing protein [Phycicoccus sp. HDW14]|uniref:DUF305 domain-containing protein n=1 Tax=Phycicoccus sp. HDW14 TaxID=2714941 RepID=UPI00140CED24|nr:DUF305 domain-containing protein [Phycicoccus sp. HDW14]QIM22427.1 DUF305 domain-containing protein [Phycicoccus sp. HDW14]